MQIEQDYYNLLDIAPAASVADIKEAYHKLAFLCHPDRNGMSLATNAKMLDINEAYTTLSDPIKRTQYDILMGYHTAVPKFKTGNKVRVNSRSSPYKDHVGVVDKEPFKDSFRFWYMVKFESNSLATVGRFAEEQLNEVGN